MTRQQQIRSKRRREQSRKQKQEREQQQHQRLFVIPLPLLQLICLYLVSIVPSGLSLSLSFVNRQKGQQPQFRATKTVIGSGSSTSIRLAHTIARTTTTRRQLTQQRNLEGEEDSDNCTDDESTNEVFNSTGSEREDERLFLQRQLERLEILEKMLEELEENSRSSSRMVPNPATGSSRQQTSLISGKTASPNITVRRNGTSSSDEDLVWDEASLLDLFGDLQDEEEDDVDSEFDEFYDDYDELCGISAATPSSRQSSSSWSSLPAVLLENALSEGVVPVEAEIGSDCLVGDFGFDPLQVSRHDTMRRIQTFFLSLLPPSRNNEKNNEGNEIISTKQEQEQSQRSKLSTTVRTKRPRALILRDYREAEIRHGRLAMLAAIFWPVEELLDRFVWGYDQVQPVLYHLLGQKTSSVLSLGETTAPATPTPLPYIPLLMTAIMLLLGYLDVYSQAVKELDEIGEAYLPGDCFWDPLRILTDAPADSLMKRNMQERELLNGRVAMIAVAVYLWEEGITRTPLVNIPGNEILLQPAYQVPFIQEWLDVQFTDFGPTTTTGLIDGIDDLLF